jgi:hypothetical protein
MSQALADPGLLENNLTDPDLVGIFCLPERQVSGVCTVPVEKPIADMPEIRLFMYVFQIFNLYSDIPAGSIQSGQDLLFGGCSASRYRNVDPAKIMLYCSDFTE